MKRAVFCLCAPFFVSARRIAHRHPHQSTPTDSPAVIYSDNRHPFRPSSPASINANRFARRLSLRLLLFVQPAAICINQRHTTHPSSSAPTTVVRSGHRHLHQSTSAESPVVIYFDNHRSFRHRRLHQPASTESPSVICINQRHTIRASPSIPTTVVRSSCCRPHQSASTESRVVSCSGRRHLLRSTPSLRLPPCASSNIIRFTRRPSRRLPAAPLGHFFHMGVGGATASGKIGCGEGGGGAVRFLRDFALFLQKCAENRAFDRIRSGRIGCFVRPAAPA